jgi:predicted GIY-YIG superfamily endonuclease
VYILTSLNFPDQNYIGQTGDVTQRLRVHNAGGSLHIAKYKPWKLVSTISFETEEKAIEFETYLKSGSRIVFMVKRLLS